MPPVPVAAAPTSQNPRLKEHVGKQRLFSPFSFPIFLWASPRRAAGAAIPAPLSRLHPRPGREQGTVPARRGCRRIPPSAGIVSRASRNPWPWIFRRAGRRPSRFPRPFKGFSCSAPAPAEGLLSQPPFLDTNWHFPSAASLLLARSPPPPCPQPPLGCSAWNFALPLLFTAFKRAGLRGGHGGIPAETGPRQRDLSRAGLPGNRHTAPVGTESFGIDFLPAMGEEKYHYYHSCYHYRHGYQ